MFHDFYDRQHGDDMYRPALALKHSDTTTTTAAATRWSIGKISVLILACLSLTDIILHMVDAQMDSLEEPYHYDALSADVIRPAFRYHHHGEQQKQKRPTMGLGSAAISSVTTALSPILPFTGGIDLRREDYWTNGWFGSVSSVVQQVRDAFEDARSTWDASSDDDEDDENDAGIHMVLETPRGGAATKSRRNNNNNNNNNKSIKNKLSSSHNYVLSNADPFAPLKEIAELTLKDVAMSFRFAVDSTRRDFQSGKFMSGLLPRAQKVVDRMTTATGMARGKGIPAPVTGGEGTPAVVSGDIDALNFCAAMRVFAEWRVLRQVPPGYKGYAVGMTLGQKDIVQNIAKIEQAVHSFVDYRIERSEDGEEPVTSPTLRDLLRYEVDTGIQDVSKLPRLKEKSAAMGLLWVRRQLQYQTAIFANVMDVPTRFESTRAAVQSAYDEVYNKYHGWAVQKIFSYSFQAAPDASEIYNYMNPHRLEEVQMEAQSRFLGDGKRRFRRSDDQSSDNPLERFGRHIGKEWDKLAGNVVQEWDKLARNVGQEWDKVARNVGQIFGQRQQQPQSLTPSMEAPALETEVLDVDDSDAKELEMENYINQEMEKDAYEHIRAYLEVAVPLLADLESLFDEFNMDDPTKV